MKVLGAGDMVRRKGGYLGKTKKQGSEDRLDESIGATSGSKEAKVFIYPYGYLTWAEAVKLLTTWGIENKGDIKNL